MKKTLATIITTSMILLAIISTGCKDSEIAQMKSFGSKHKITVYSGRIAVAIYHSTGNVSNESSTDGWYFEDASTHKLVEVAGTLIIEQE